MNRSFPGSAALLLAAIAIVTCVQTGFAQFGTGAPAPEEANRPRLIGLRPVSNETGNNRRLPSAQVEGLVLDGSRKPMKGIEVYVQDSAPLGKTLKAKTDASGRYSIGALTPGNYQSCAVWEGASGLCRELKVQDREQWSSDFVLFGLNGGCPWRGSGYIGTNFDWCGGRPVGFTGGKCSLNSSDRLDSASRERSARSAPKPDSRLEGAVFDTLSRPAKDMAVYVFGLDKPHDRAACTNGKGQYSIERLEPGRYVACLAHNGVFGLCHDFTVREAQKEKNDFHLTAFRQTDEEALLNRLPPGSRLGPGSPFASLDGRVFDETGAPVGGIEVHLERTDWGRTPQRFKTTTDAQGRFSFAVFSGEYVVGVQHKGKIGLLRAFTLRSRRQVLTDFDLNHFPPG